MNDIDKLDKVYVVTAGDYEDYHIICVFDNQLDAERYIALHQLDSDSMMFIEEHDICRDEELNNMIIYYGIEFYVRDNEHQFTDYHIVFKNKTIDGNITRTQRCYAPDTISGIIPIPCRIADENIIKKLICDAVTKFRAEEKENRYL